jgi:alpha-L-fucosidase
MRKIAALLVAVGAAAQAQTYTPTAENLAARQWFQDSRFGMFIHWGVYSVLGDGEWVMNNRKMSVAEYEKLAPRFDPEKFDAAAWVALAKSAGMKYITFTTKHHDGFAMWGTKQSKWNVVDATPYHKDVVKMLAEECQRQGIKLFVYHSQLDWHNPDYFPLGQTGHYSGRPAGGDFDKYLDYMNAQLRELLTGYGPIAGVWFDGMWDKPEANWRLEKTYTLIHSLQPAALIGSNHHRAPYPGEDFQMFEKDLPGQRTQEFNTTSVVGKLPLETCDTINYSWGYNSNDDHYKSSRELIQYLVRAAGNDANFLLNIGPRPDGTIQPEFVERLHAMGAWLEKNGESIYGTREGPVTPRNWGVTTKKGNKVYLHVLDWQDEVLAMPKIAGIRSARLFPNGGEIETQQLSGATLVRIPAAQRDPVDTIVELEVGG